MAAYTTGQAERLLGLPASTLRFWEREVSLIEPRKDAFGRRVYSEADLRLLLRLRHLALRRGLGLSAASRALVAELSGPNPEARARLAAVRGELVALYFASQEAGRRLEPIAAARVTDSPGRRGGSRSDLKENRKG